MKTTDPRDLTWDELRSHLTGLRARVWLALAEIEPATTSEIAAHLGWSVLTVRPRVTELAQIGFVECLGRKGREGLYQHLTEVEVKAAHQSQTQLPL